MQIININNNISSSITIAVVIFHCFEELTKYRFCLR